MGTKIPIDWGGLQKRREWDRVPPCQGVRDQKPDLLLWAGRAMVAVAWIVLIAAFAAAGWVMR